MSSYVANSFYKQSQNVPAYSMQSYGNYGSVSEVPSSRYCYSGLDLSITFPSPGSSNSLNGLDMPSNPTTNSDRPSCNVMGTSGHTLGRGDQGALSPGIYNQKAGSTSLEDRSKGIENIKSEPVLTTPQGQQQPQQAQPQQTQQQQQQPPQIYPWMTKLHMSHGKLSLLAFVSLGFFFSFFFCIGFYRPYGANNKKNPRS